MSTNEKWLPAVGYEGLYSVSNKGRVRSEQRVILNRGNPTQLPSVMLKPQSYKNGHRRVWLCGKQYTVHDLVLAAFVGPKPDQLWGLHRDDDKANNSVGNLYYGTPRQNSLDVVKNGNHWQTNKTQCVNGHKFTQENTIVSQRPNGRTMRNCRQCAKKHNRESMERRSKAAQLNTETATTQKRKIA